MTLRERLEAKLEKRSEWAQKAKFKASERFGAAHKLGSMIPFGQPILVGHHSEGRARADAQRIIGNMQKGVELSKLADHHEGAAEGLERQLKNSVFSDDVDAIEQLEAKIAKAEALQAKVKATNAAIRKHAKKGPAAQVAALVVLGYTEVQAVAALTPDFCGTIGVPSYVSTNNAANIRRMKKRIEEIKVRQARTVKAEEAGGVLVEKGGEYARVTFPEKPAREVLEALRAAGFNWGGGSWVGKTEKLPEGLV